MSREVWHNKFFWGRYVHRHNRVGFYFSWDGYSKKKYSWRFISQEKAPKGSEIKTNFFLMTFFCCRNTCNLWNCFGQLRKIPNKKSHRENCFNDVKKYVWRRWNAELVDWFLFFYWFRARLKSLLVWKMILLRVVTRGIFPRQSSKFCFDLFPRGSNFYFPRNLVSQKLESYVIFFHFYSCSDIEFIGQIGTFEVNWIFVKSSRKLFEYIFCVVSITRILNGVFHQLILDSSNWESFSEFLEKFIKV